MEVALWGENYEGGTVGRELWRWHCAWGEALWGENYGDGTVGRGTVGRELCIYGGGTVGRELWRWHCGERTMEVAL